jgi:hypothetical protein
MGYGISDDAMNRLDRTKKVMDKDPFIGIGPHVLDVVKIEPFNHDTHGPSVRAVFEVVESQTMTVGSRCVKLWFLFKPSKFVNQTNDADRFADFVEKLKNPPPGSGYTAGPDCRKLLKERVEDQLARGTRIRAIGRNTAKPDKPVYVDVAFTPVEQTPESVRANRARIEVNIGIASAAEAQQQSYAQPPAQQSYAAPPPQQNYAPQQQTQPQQQQTQAYVPGNLPPNTGNGGGGNTGGSSW